MKSHPGGREQTERLLKIADLLPGSRVIDLGAGEGKSLKILENMGFDAVGIDIEPRGEQVIKGNLLDTGFESESFEGVLSECSFYVSGNQKAAIQEAARLLKKGGTLILEDVFFENKSGICVASGDVVNTDTIAMSEKPAGEIKNTDAISMPEKTVGEIKNTDAIAMPKKSVGDIENADVILMPEKTTGDTQDDDIAATLGTNGFEIILMEDMTDIWREYYIEALWRGDEMCQCSFKGKCRYLNFICRKHP